MAECFFRIFRESFSKDITNIKQFPDISEKIRNNSSSKKILFLGNSLTLKSVNLELFDSKLSKKGIDSFWTAKAMQDGTTVLDWYLIFQNYFVRENAIPDIIVIGFIRTHLEDRSRYNLRRIGAFYCGQDQLLELFRDHIHSFGDRTFVLLARTFSMFSVSDRLRGRILELCLPNYRLGLSEIRKVLLTNPSIESQDQAHKYIALKKLINLFKENNILAVFVALPTVERWDIKPEQVKLIEAKGMKIIDCRDALLIPSLHFQDASHLNKNGAKIFTSLLAERFVDVMDKYQYDISKN